MIETAVNSASADSVEAVLRDELARGDAAGESVTPILRHLLASEDNSLFGDDVMARVRGMISDVSGQLLAAIDAVEPAQQAGEANEDPRIPDLVGAFVENTAFLNHVHALAVEWQLTERLQARLSLDPVLSPLLQALIASSDGTTSGLAMKLLASQARFCQSQRRMQLPLSELPGDLLHGALTTIRALAGGEPELDVRAAAAEAEIRSGYDEAATRLGMIARLVSGMGGGAVAALSVAHAGVAMFLSTLAIGSGQDRDAVVFSTNETQLARLALALRSAGLKPAGVQEQFLALHPDVELPPGFETLGADRAAAILAVGGGYSGG